MEPLGELKPTFNGSDKSMSPLGKGGDLQVSWMAVMSAVRSSGSPPTRQWRAVIDKFRDLRRAVARVVEQLEQFIVGCGGRVLCWSGCGS
jgi:hypothetical protein